MMQCQKGQLFSLDFLIAAGVAVLAVGIMLNYYDAAITSEKEGRLQNELNAIAMNASTQMLEKNRCATDFDSQGYKLYGCYYPGPGSSFKTLQKEELMVPEGFECNATWKNLSTGTSDSQTASSDLRCRAAPPAAGDIASVDRNFLAPASGNSIDKTDYETCVFNYQDCTEIYDEYTLNMKVWRI